MILRIILMKVIMILSLKTALLTIRVTFHV